MVVSDDIPEEYQPVNILLSNQVCTSLSLLEDTPECARVPEYCLHDSIITNALAHLGLKNTLIGRSPDRLIVEEIIESVEILGTLPEETETYERTRVVLPLGKANILKAISAECGRVNYPDESRVTTALFDIGIQEAESDFEASSVIWNRGEPQQPEEGWQP